jgi:hypothetical protein
MLELRAGYRVALTATAFCVRGLLARDRELDHCRAQVRPPSEVASMALPLFPLAMPITQPSLSFTKATAVGSKSPVTARSELSSVPLWVAISKEVGSGDGGENPTKMAVSAFTALNGPG